MTLDPARLLQSLLPTHTPARTTQIGASGANTDFAQMLAGAREGKVASGLGITIAKGANVELSDEQLARLSLAADRAEAHGVQRGAFVIDGQVVSMDVPTRTVTGALRPGDPVSQSDAVLVVPGADEVGGAALPPPPSWTGAGMNPTLLDALSTMPRDGARDSAA